MTKINSPRLTETDFFSLLHVPAMDDAGARERRLQTRIIALGHGKSCGRCGGSGNFSFNVMNGTTCFGCRGSGYGKQELTPLLFDALKRDVDAGKLDSYLADLRAKADARKKATVACRQIEDLYRKLTPQYDWMKAAIHIQPHCDLANLVQVPLNAINDKIRWLKDQPESIACRKVKTPEERQLRDQDIQRALENLLAGAEESLREMEKLITVEPAIRERWSGAPDASVDCLAGSYSVTFGEQTIPVPHDATDSRNDRDVARTILDAAYEQWLTSKEVGTSPHNDFSV